eukprot:12219-Heterococcus_DN1.PRE.1
MRSADSMQHNSPIAPLVAVELTGENHELVELTEITAQKETAVAAALAATDEKNRLQDQLSAERAAAELKTAADAGALAALNSKYDLLYDELAARDKQLAAMTARATEAEAEIFAGKLSKTLDNMLADNRNAFQRWRDSPTQPTAAADVASFKQVVLAACMLQVHVVTEFERFMKSSTVIGSSAVMHTLLCFSKRFIVVNSFLNGVDHAGTATATAGDAALLWASDSVVAMAAAADTALIGSIKVLAAATGLPPTQSLLVHALVLCVMLVALAAWLCKKLLTKRTALVGVAAILLALLWYSGIASHVSSRLVHRYCTFTKRALTQSVCLCLPQILVVSTHYSAARGSVAFNQQRKHCAAVLCTVLYQGALQLGGAVGALVGAVVALGARVAPVMPFAPELYFMVQFLYTCLTAFGTLVLSVATVLVAVVKSLVLLALDYAATCRPVQFLASFVLTSDKEFAKMSLVPHGAALYKYVATAVLPAVVLTGLARGLRLVYRRTKPKLIKITVVIVQVRLRSACKRRPASQRSAALVLVKAAAFRAASAASLNTPPMSTFELLLRRLSMSPQPIVTSTAAQQLLQLFERPATPAALQSPSASTLPAAAATVAPANGAPTANAAAASSTSTTSHPPPNPVHGPVPPPAAANVPQAAATSPVPLPTPVSAAHTSATAASAAANVPPTVHTAATNVAPRVVTSPVASPPGARQSVETPSDLAPPTESKASNGPFKVAPTRQQPVAEVSLFIVRLQAWACAIADRSVQSTRDAIVIDCTMYHTASIALELCGALQAAAQQRQE